MKVVKGLRCLMMKPFWMWTRLRTILQTLKDANRFTLAIATGRPRNEVIEPLTALGLLSFFDPKRIVTYDEVLAAEEQLNATSGPIKLGKPHPFVVLKALHVDEDPQRFCTRSLSETRSHLCCLYWRCR